MDANQLISLSTLAKQQGQKTQFKRELYELIISHSDKTFLGIIGARGVGKSTIFKQALSEVQDSIYISLDVLEELDDLFEIIQELNLNYKFKIFFLDEVHFLKNFNRDLKKIFDFLDIKIIFTSSVALKIIESSRDLSRRIKLVNLEAFTFYEYLKFINVGVPEKLSLTDIFDHKFGSEYLRFQKYFEAYLQGENLPFSSEVSDIIIALRNNVEKIITSDIARLVNLQFSEMEIIKKMLIFISRSPVSDINPTTIAKNLQITRYKADQYLEYLEDSFVIRKILPKGTNVLKEPKILLFLPYRLLYSNFEDSLGGLREDFAVQCLAALTDVSYLKSKLGKKTPDFIIEYKNTNYVIEVGGFSKTFSQFKGIDEKFKKVILADKFVASENKIPLYLLGFIDNQFEYKR